MSDKTIKVLMKMHCDLGDGPRYEPGLQYDLPEEIATAWIGAGYAVALVAVVMRHTMTAPSGATYQKGERYDVPDEVAEAWVASGYCDRVVKVVTVTMLKTTATAHQGYGRGKQFDLPEDMAQEWIEAGYCEPVAVTEAREIAHREAEAEREPICLWAEVDTNAPKEMRQYCIVGTGYDVPDQRFEYLGTVQSPNQLPPPPLSFVWHVYLASSNLRPQLPGGVRVA